MIPYDAAISAENLEAFLGILNEHCPKYNLTDYRTVKSLLSFDDWITLRCELAKFILYLKIEVRFSDERRISKYFETSAQLGIALRVDNLYNHLIVNDQVT